MTDIPNLAFEAQLWTATHRINAKKEETYVVVLHAHPLEAAQLMDSDLLGKRFQCVLVAIGDDEHPVKVGGVQTTDGLGNVATMHPAEQKPAGDLDDLYDEVIKNGIPPTMDTPEVPRNPPKERRAFHDLRRSQQAGILCHDEQFWGWFGRFGPVTDSDSCAMRIRDWCDVSSRADLDRRDVPAKLWDSLVSDYRQATGAEAERRG